MRAVILFAVLMAIVASAVSVGDSSTCELAVQGSNSTMNLNQIKPATYNATLVGVQNGEMAVSFDFSWCAASTNSATCNATNQSMTMTTMTSNLGKQCVIAFNTVQQAAATSSSAATLVLWSVSSGDIATVTVSCDAQGTPGTATLVGSIVQPHIYSYNLAFTSVHACA